MRTKAQSAWRCVYEGRSAGRLVGAAAARVHGGMDGGHDTRLEGLQNRALPSGIEMNSKRLYKSVPHETLSFASECAVNQLRLRCVHVRPTLHQHLPKQLAVHRVEAFAVAQASRETGQARPHCYLSPYAVEDPIRPHHLRHLRGTLRPAQREGEGESGEGFKTLKA